MRIISKYHDYYDAALAYGADERVVYKRVPEELKPLPVEWQFMRPAPHFIDGLRSKTLDFRKHWFNIRPVVVVVAGKIYHGIGVAKKYKNSFFNPHDEEEFFYDLDAYKAHFEENKIPHPKLTKRETHYRRKFGRREPWWLGYLNYVEGAEKWFTVERPDEHRDFFIERKIPIATSTTTERYRRNSDDSVELNGNLKKYQFYRRLDAFQTYQELDMFVAGTMTQEDNPMASIGDEDLARAKGFDCYSFKKGPTKRAPKECKK